MSDSRSVETDGRVIVRETAPPLRIMPVDAVPARADVFIRTLSVAGHRGLACLHYHADLRSLDAAPFATALAWCDSVFGVRNDRASGAINSVGGAGLPGALVPETAHDVAMQNKHLQAHRV